MTRESDGKSEKPKWRPNKLSKKYGHLSGNKKQKSGVNDIKTELRNVKRLLQRLEKNLETSDGRSQETSDGRSQETSDGRSQETSDGRSQGKREGTQTRSQDHGIKRELESKIKSLQHQLDRKLQIANEQKLNEKYKYIRFVEKKKLTRRLKKAETNQEKEKVERQIRYVDYYPVDIKYLALFPHLEAAKELEKSEGAEKDTFAETTTTASVEAILSKIDAFHEKGLVVPGFTWRWNQKTTNEEDDQAILNNKDSTTMEQDDFFVM